MEFPKCPRCPSGQGALVPLSDFGPDGSSMTYKSWVCTDRKCGYTIKTHKGDPVYTITIENNPVYKTV